jgi:hypothetical protein
MTTGDWALALVLAVAVLALVLGWLYGHIMWKDGHEAGRQLERNRQNQRRINENRARPPATSLAGGRPPWYTVVTPTRLVRGGIGGPSTLPIPSQRASRFPAAITTTGALRALTDDTDEYIRKMKTDNEAYLLGLRQEISA